MFDLPLAVRQRDPGFKVIWIFAFNHKKIKKLLTREEIIKTPIINLVERLESALPTKTGELIQASKKFSLYLTGNLILGAVRLYEYQINNVSRNIEILNDKINQYLIERTRGIDRYSPLSFDLTRNESVDITPSPIEDITTVPVFDEHESEFAPVLHDQTQQELIAAPIVEEIVKNKEQGINEPKTRGRRQKRTVRFEDDLFSEDTRPKRRKVVRNKDNVLVANINEISIIDGSGHAIGNVENDMMISLDRVSERAASVPPAYNDVDKLMTNLTVSKSHDEIFRDAATIASEQYKEISEQQVEPVEFFEPIEEGLIIYPGDHTETLIEDTADLPMIFAAPSTPEFRPITEGMVFEESSFRHPLDQPDIPDDAIALGFINQPEIEETVEVGRESVGLTRISGIEHSSPFRNLLDGIDVMEIHEPSRNSLNHQGFIKKRPRVKAMRTIDPSLRKKRFIKSRESRSLAINGEILQRIKKTKGMLQDVEINTFFEIAPLFESLLVDERDEVITQLEPIEIVDHVRDTVCEPIEQIEQNVPPTIEEFEYVPIVEDIEVEPAPTELNVAVSEAVLETDENLIEQTGYIEAVPIVVDRYILSPTKKYPESFLDKPRSLVKQSKYKSCDITPEQFYDYLIFKAYEQKTAVFEYEKLARGWIKSYVTTNFINIMFLNNNKKIVINSTIKDRTVFLMLPTPEFKLKYNLLIKAGNSKK